VDRRARELVDPKGIRVFAAKISGTLDLSFVAVPFPLRLRRCRLLEDAELKYVEIPALYLHGSWVRGIVADGARVNGDVFLRRGFHAEGEVRLLGAEIGGVLDCERGTFKNPAQKGVEGTGIALTADRIKVTGGVYLRNDFSSEGEVRLLGAEIGGVLDCERGTFKNPAKTDVPGSGDALSADRIKVRGGVFLRNGFNSEGEVRLLGAEIGGYLDCELGTFKNPAQKDVPDSGDALSADRMKVKGSVFLRNGFSAEGEVRLPGAEIGGDLECRGGGFTRISALSAVIKGKLVWDSIINAEKAELDLTNASADSIMDDKASWPAEGRLFLNGFVYGRISQGPGTAEERLKWLARQVPFHTQPYRQLAKVLREGGDEDGARKVLFEMEDRHWKAKPGWKARIWRLLLKPTIGYGRHPLWALQWLGGLVFVGCLFYILGYAAGHVVPREKDAYRFFEMHQRPPEYIDAFSPLVYSLENSFPLVKLGQADNWQPAPILHSPYQSWRSFLFERLTGEGILGVFLWFQICAGWVLATLFVAGVTGIIRSD